MTALKKLGNAIREERQRNGLSQTKLASLAGIHRNYVGDVERGTRNIGIINLMRVAKALDVPLSRLIGDMERMAKPGRKPVNGN